MLDQWILIGLLAAATYISRIIGVEMMEGRELSPTLRLYFNYLPAAIISALIVKQILVPVNGQLFISIPVLIGCIAASIIIKISKSFLPSLVIGIIIGLLARYFLI